VSVSSILMLRFFPNDFLVVCLPTPYCCLHVRSNVRYNRRVRILYLAIAASLTESSSSILPSNVMTFGSAAWNVYRRIIIIDKDETYHEAVAQVADDTDDSLCNDNNMTSERVMKREMSGNDIAVCVKQR